MTGGTVIWFWLTISRVSVCRMLPTPRTRSCLESTLFTSFKTKNVLDTLSLPLNALNMVPTFPVIPPSSRK